MSEKKKYVDAKIEVIDFEDINIITTSGGETEPEGNPDDWGWTT